MTRPRPVFSGWGRSARRCGRQGQTFRSSTTTPRCSPRPHPRRKSIGTSTSRITAPSRSIRRLSTMFFSRSFSGHPALPAHPSSPHVCASANKWHALEKVRGRASRGGNSAPSSPSSPASPRTASPGSLMARRLCAALHPGAAAQDGDDAGRPRALPRLGADRERVVRPRLHRL